MITGAPEWQQFDNPFGTLVSGRQWWEQLVMCQSLMTLSSFDLIDWLACQAADPCWCHNCIPEHEAAHVNMCVHVAAGITSPGWIGRRYSIGATHHFLDAVCSPALLVWDSFYKYISDRHCSPTSIFYITGYRLLAVWFACWWDETSHQY